ncbi:GPALPP motifs-containing protein 1 [Spea bombifrons]|uniref:GPALPP motifs-containing protein 1 n=1 Tax=Spea bombifrons TaxID=233779 RepID=UPI0023493FBC|nr:GPALPP motifs-containing protein 1 [Spea bombifrons]
MSRELIGPALPPGFLNSEGQEDTEEVAGPVLPPGYSCNSSTDSSDDSDQDSTPNPWHDKSGPCTSKRSKDSHRKLSPSRAEEEDDFFGPALPPGFKKHSDSPERPVIGPALPPGFKREHSDSEDSPDHGGSCNPSGFREGGQASDEDEVIGPLPAEGPAKSSVFDDFERRALKMKQKLTATDDDGLKSATRESWMTELPPEMTAFGLGPRSFKRRTNEKSGDRSIWTDTPADRERKIQEKQEAKVSSSKEVEILPLSERDKRLADQVSTYNDSKRSKSLMDIHQKKLKRKAEEDKNKPQERRPFDRDQDLQVNRFDDAQKKALFRKSKELNTKFSHGNSSMFL